MAAPAQLRFIRNKAELKEFLGQLKLMACPHCGISETLNAHGPLRGYAEVGSEIVIRGWRVYCSNRGRQRGCGRTFSALLADVLWGFLVRAETLRCFVQAVLSGTSKARAWAVAAPHFSLRSGYRLWKRLSQRQVMLRPLLHRNDPAPVADGAEPLLALWEHLKSGTQHSSSLILDFQLRFQRPLLG